MSSEGLDLLNSLLDWHRQHGAATIPCQGMDYPDDIINAFKRAYDGKSVDLAIRFVDTGNDIPKPDHYVGIAANALPLISGCLSGFSTEQLVNIARGHGIWVKDFLETFSTNEQILRVHETSEMTGDEVFRRCFAALAVTSPEEIRDVYDKLMYNDHYYMLAITTPDAPRLWPKTIMTQYLKAHEGKDVPEGEVISGENHSFIRSLHSDQQLPWDDNGPRYDWLLDRSGMLLPAVFKKSIANFSLWEELVYYASEDQDSPLSHVMTYCIEEPPQSLRPGIFNGLRSMISLASGNISHGNRLFAFLEEKLAGTWLEPLLDSKILKLNLLGENSAQHAWRGDQALIQSLFSEIKELAPSEMGFAHFHVLSVQEKPLVTQHFDEGFGRESFICHLLTGLQCFISDARFSEETLSMVGIATHNCREAIKLLGVNHEFDYTQFRGLSSPGLRILIDAGLDIRRLPKMNPRDRGRLLEDELGM
jgi:hypothetical protein